MLFKLSNLNLNIALTLGYLNPALNNLVQYLLSLFFFFLQFSFNFQSKVSVRHIRLSSKHLFR